MSYLCRYILLTLLFLFAFFVGLGQESFVISCQVVDDVRGKPLPNVYVALNNTRMGMSTSANGMFKFDVSYRELSNDFFISCSGCYDTLIPAKRLINVKQIVLRTYRVDLDDVNIVAALNKEKCFGDTAYMFGDEAAKTMSYHLDYGHSVGILFKNTEWGQLNKLYVRIANDNYYSGKFAVRIKKIPHRKNYFFGLKFLKKYKDVVAEPIIITALYPGVVEVDLSDLHAFIPERNDILVLLYPLEDMNKMENYYSGYYTATSRRQGNVNMAVHSYIPCKPKDSIALFLFNDECIVAKFMYPPQIALTMRSYEKE